MKRTSLPFRAISKITWCRSTQSCSAGPIGIQHQPDDLLVRDDFNEPLPGIVDVLVPVGEFVAELCSAALDVSRPPSADIGDGVKNLFRRLVDREGRGEALDGHLKLLFVLLTG